MQKIDKVVKRETGFIAVWMLIFSAILQAIFLIIGKWDYTVLLGNLVSVALAVLNFLVMGITVQKMLGREEKDAKQGMKASAMLRLLVVFVVAGVAVLLPYFSAWTVIIPLFFPRIIIMIRPLFEKRMAAQSSADTVPDEAEKGGTDEE